MDKRKYDLSKYALTAFLISLIAVFTFVTQPFQTANAIQFVNVSLTDFNVRGGTYASTNNSWYFTSIQNNTIFRIVDNTSSVAQRVVLTTGINSCSAPASSEYIDSITGANRYIAVLCRNGVNPSTLEIRTTANLGIRSDIETGFSGFDDELFLMHEYVTGAKLFITDITSGGGFNLYKFDLTKINSTTTSMFENRFNYGAPCALGTFNAVMVENNHEMWLACNSSADGDAHIAVINLDTMALTHDLDLSIFNSFTAGIDFNSVTNTVIASNDIGEMWSIDANSKTVTQLFGIVCAQTADLAVNDNTNEVYVLCVSDDTLREYSIVTNSQVASFGVLDLGSAGLPSAINDFPTINGRISGNKTNFWIGYSISNTFGGTEATTKNYLTNIFDGALTVAGSATVCIDVDPLVDVEQLVCFDDVNGDGIPDATGSNPRVTQTVTQSINTINCQVGLVSCTNSDIKTNGTGYLLLLFLILVSVALLYAMSHRAERAFDEIPMIIWVLVIVVDTGIAFFLGWTDGIPFFFSIVAIIALASYRGYRAIGGG